MFVFTGILCGCVHLSASYLGGEGWPGIMMMIMKMTINDDDDNDGQVKPPMRAAGALR